MDEPTADSRCEAELPGGGKLTTSQGESAHVVDTGDRDLRARRDDGIDSASGRSCRHKTERQIHRRCGLIGVDDMHQLIQNHAKSSTHGLRLTAHPRPTVEWRPRAGLLSAIPQHPSTGGERVRA